MNQEIPNAEAMLQTLIKQEEALQFERFTFDNAWQLGLVLRERLLAHGGDGAADVTVAGVQLFRCAVGEPTPNNTRWIRRKMNTVLETWKSSLRVYLEMHLSNRTPEEFGMNATDFVLAGGCFPIRVRGQGVIGTVTVSGFPQTHDHQLAADAVAAYLQVSIPSILD